MATSVAMRLNFTGPLVVDILEGRKRSTLRAAKPNVAVGETITLAWKRFDKPFATAVVTNCRSWRAIDLSARERRALQAVYDPLPARVWRITFEVADRLDGAVPAQVQHDAPV